MCHSFPELRSFLLWINITLSYSILSEIKNPSEMFNMRWSKNTLMIQQLLVASQSLRLESNKSVTYMMSPAAAQNFKHIPYSSSTGQTLQDEVQCGWGKSPKTSSHCFKSNKPLVKNSPSIMTCPSLLARMFFSWVLQRVGVWVWEQMAF